MWRDSRVSCVSFAAIHGSGNLCYELLQRPIIDQQVSGTPVYYLNKYSVLVYQYVLIIITGTRVTCTRCITCTRLAWLRPV